MIGLIDVEAANTVSAESNIATSQYIIDALLIPRKELARVLEERDELKTSGIYFLFGKENAENQNAIECYIGESEELHKRLDHHNKNILDKSGIFLEDQLFSSPSAAAGTILKGSYNGWDVWKNNRNQSLNEVYRSTISNE